jgi:NADPH:quinone reductase-like Zn-dependent oxidoreductase
MATETDTDGDGTSLRKEADDSVVGAGIGSAQGDIVAGDAPAPARPMRQRQVHHPQVRAPVPGHHRRLAVDGAARGIDISELDAVINYDREDLKTRVRELTGGRGADLVVDPVGGAYSEPAVRATAWEGRFLVVGFAAGEIPRIPLNLTLLRGCQIVGVDWGALSRDRPAETRPVLETLGEWAAAGELSPLVTSTWPLAEAGRALRAVLDRQVTGKAILLS